MGVLFPKDLKIGKIVILCYKIVIWYFGQIALHYTAVIIMHVINVDSTHVIWFLYLPYIQLHLSAKLCLLAKTQRTISFW